MQLQRRDIDVDAEVGDHLAPHAGIRQREVEDIDAERIIAGVVFEEGDEASGRDFAERGVNPAKERFRADNSAGNTAAH